MSPVDSYLVALDASLHGSRRRKRDLLREAADHLVDATEANEAAGLSREEAERRAVHDFGDTATVAPAYQAILSVEQSRRLAVWLFLVILAQPFAWDARDDATTDGLPATLNELIELSGMVSILFAVLAVVGCGVAVRFVGVREWLLRLSLTSALVSSVLIASISAALLLTTGPVTPGRIGFISLIVWVPMGAIAVGSVLGLRAVDATRALSDLD